MADTPKFYHLLIQNYGYNLIVYALFHFYCRDNMQVLNILSKQKYFFALLSLLESKRVGHLLWMSLLKPGFEFLHCQLASWIYLHLISTKQTLYINLHLLHSLLIKSHKTGQNPDSAIQQLSRYGQIQLPKTFYTYLYSCKVSVTASTLQDCVRSE